MADPDPASIGARLSRGVAVTAGSQVVKLGTQVISVVVLSRMLTPEDFGLVAMVAPVVGLVSLFQDVGLSQALIQRERITDEQISSVFWINLLIAVLLGLLTAALAPAVALFYREPALAGLTVGFAATFVLTGISGQTQALLQRQLRFGALAALDIVAAIAGIVASIVVALIHPSAWALFASTVAYRLVAAIAAWMLTGFRPQRPNFGTGIGDMVRFGGGLTVVNLSNYLLRNADNVMVGAYWGAEVLGTYERAYQLLLFPLQQVSWPLGRIMITALSRLQSDPVRYRQTYLGAIRLMLLVVEPGIVWTIATADRLLPTVLGPQWVSCVPIFVVLGITGLQQPMTGSIGWLLISQRRGRALLWWGTYSLLITLPAFALGLPWGGVGVALGYAASDVLLRTPIYWWLGTREGPVTLRDLLGLAAPQVLGSASAFLGVMAFRHAVPLRTVLDLFGALLVAYACSLPVVLAFAGQRATATEGLAGALKLWPRRVPFPPSGPASQLAHMDSERS